MDVPNFLDYSDSIVVQPSKTADWMSQHHLKDPLQDPQTNQTEPVPKWEEKGKRWGTALGAVGGGLAGLAMPLVMGHNIGAMGAEGATTLGHEMTGDLGHPGHISADADAFASHASGAAGAAMAAPHALWTTPLGAGLGAMSGGELGRFMGHQTEHAYSPTRRAVEQIRRSSPGQGHALIKTIEQTNDYSPEAIEAMRQAYNQRRESIRDQVMAGTNR